MSGWLRLFVHHALVHPLYAVPLGERWRELVDVIHEVTSP